MANVIEFRQPDPQKGKSCSWCKKRNTHPMDPPCDKCKWYDRDIEFDYTFPNGRTVKVRKIVDPDTLQIKLIPAEKGEAGLKFSFKLLMQTILDKIRN